MAARRIWTALAIELAIYAAILLLVSRLGCQVTVPNTVIAVCIAMVLARVCLVLASFAISKPLADAAPLRPGQRVGMWFAECVAFFRFQRLIMFASREPLPVFPQGRQSDTAPLAILLHGFVCNGGIWKPIAQRLADRAGCEVRTPSLPRVDAGIAEQTTDFSDWLRGIADANPHRPIVIVGHSLGGLIALRRACEGKDASPIAAIVCIGTPHHGSKVARLSRTRIAKELRPGSAALAHPVKLHSLEVSVLNIQATHDNLVVPAASGTLDGARNIAIAACGHMALIYSPPVLDVLVAEIRSVVPAAMRLQVPLVAT